MQGCQLALACVSGGYCFHETTFHHRGQFEFLLEASIGAYQAFISADNEGLQVSRACLHSHFHGILEH